MIDRESVIDALEYLISEDCTDNQFDYADEIEAAIALLKEQEPRVMTLIEWIRAPEPVDGECMCYEIKDKGLQAMLVKAFDGARHLYGKAFRCWTSRPTDEQMEATLWKE